MTAKSFTEALAARSVEDIRADLAVMDDEATWSDRYHDAMVRILRDVEPLLASLESARNWAVHLECQNERLLAGGA